MRNSESKQNANDDESSKLVSKILDEASSRNVPVHIHLNNNCGTERSTALNTLFETRIIYQHFPNVLTCRVRCFQNYCLDRILQITHI